MDAYYASTFLSATKYEFPQKIHDDYNALKSEKKNFFAQIFIFYQKEQC